MSVIVCGGSWMAWNVGFEDVIFAVYVHGILPSHDMLSMLTFVGASIISPRNTSVQVGFSVTSIVAWHVKLSPSLYGSAIVAVMVYDHTVPYMCDVSYGTIVNCSNELWSPKFNSPSTLLSGSPIPCTFMFALFPAPSDVGSTVILQSHSHGTSLKHSCVQPSRWYHSGHDTPNSPMWKYCFLSGVDANSAVLQNVLSIHFFGQFIVDEANLLGMFSVHSDHIKSLSCCHPRFSNEFFGNGHISSAAIPASVMQL